MKQLTILIGLLIFGAVGCEVSPTFEYEDLVEKATEWKPNNHFETPQYVDTDNAFRIVSPAAMDFVENQKSSFVIEAYSAYKNSQVRLTIKKPTTETILSSLKLTALEKNKWALTWKPARGLLDANSFFAKEKVVLSMKVSSQDPQTQAALKEAPVVRQEKEVSIYLHKEGSDIPKIQILDKSPVVFEYENRNKAQSFYVRSTSKQSLKDHPVTTYVYATKYTGEIVSGTDDITDVTERTNYNGQQQDVTVTIQLNSDTLAAIESGCRSIKKRITVQAENTFTRVRSAEKFKNIIIKPNPECLAATAATKETPAAKAQPADKPAATQTAAPAKATPTAAPPTAPVKPAAKVKPADKPAATTVNPITASPAKAADQTKATPTAAPTKPKTTTTVNPITAAGAQSKSTTAAQPKAPATAPVKPAAEVKFPAEVRSTPAKPADQSKTINEKDKQKDKTVQQ